MKSRRIEAQMKLKGENVSQIAELLGLNIKSVYDRISGKVPWTCKDISILAEHFEVTSDYLLDLD